MNEILRLFEHLEIPSFGGNTYSVTPVPGAPSLLIAKSSDGAPAVLHVLDAEVRTSAAPIRLRHLAVQPRVRARIRQKRETSESKVTVYQCQAHDPALQSYFLTAVVSALTSDALAADAEPGAVVRLLAELFRSLETKGRSTAQGLWAELFVIQESTKPAALISAWHEDVNERYDFSWGADRLEVKSTGRLEREHHFALEQVRPHPPLRVWIASLFAVRSTGGTSLGELVEAVRVRAASPREAFKVDEIVARALGDSMPDALDARYDVDVARSSLRFFRAEDVPWYEELPPSAVRNIRFEATLNEIAALDRGAVEELSSDLLRAASRRGEAPAP